MHSKVKVTLKCLLENKLRFILTILSIAIGVTSVLIINSISDFGVAAISSELDSLGMNGLIVTKDSDNCDLTDIEAEKIKSLDGISQVAPVTIKTSKVYSNDTDSISAMIWGIDERSEDVVSFELLSGRFIDKGDIKSGSKVCMLDQSLAQELFGKDNIVGKKIDLLCNLTVESFQVIGVVKTGKGMMQSLMGTYFPAFLYAPYTAFDNSPNYNQFFLKIDGTKPSDEITETVEKQLNGDFRVTDLAGQKGVLERMLNIVTVILMVIGAISLLVSGISIMNIMLISVNERVKEIGIKKSIGATGRDILIDFLNESIVIAVIGTAIGIITAILITKTTYVFLGYKIYIKAKAIFYSIIISVTLGIMFGIFPAYKASKFKPVEALRR